MTSADTYQCPLCGGRERRPLRGVSGYGRCAGCGLVCNDREDPPEGYQGDYFTADAPEKGHRDFESPAARHYDERRFGEELRRLGPPPPGGRLLDVGSATGSFLAIAARHGWHVVGVEISEEARAIAAGRGVDSRADLAEVESLGPFEVITLHHVLEHLADPVGTLRRLRVILVPHGRLLIEVPNWRSLERRAMGQHWTDLRPTQHRWHWEPRTLRNAVEGAGFEVKSVTALGEPIPSPASVLRSLGVPERWLEARRSRRALGAPSGAPSDADVGPLRARDDSDDNGSACGPPRPVALAAAVIDAGGSRLLVGKRLVVEAVAPA